MILYQIKKREAISRFYEYWSEEEDTTKAERVVKYNEKFNVPEQTEEEEAETHENAKVENLADNDKIKRRKVVSSLLNNYANDKI